MKATFSWVAADAAKIRSPSFSRSSSSTTTIGIPALIAAIAESIESSPADGLVSANGSVSTAGKIFAMSSANTSSAGIT